MKNTKRYIAVVTSVIMAVSMFAGCGNSASETVTTNEQKSATPKNSNKKNDEMTMGDTAAADDNNFNNAIGAEENTYNFYNSYKKAI